MKVTIVGVRKSESKGKDVFNYYGLKDFTDYEVQNSDCVGQAVVSEFSYIDYGLCVGDVVEFLYEPGFQGRASLVDIRVLTPAEQVKPSGAGTDKAEQTKSPEPGTDKKETK